MTFVPIALDIGPADFPDFFHGWGDQQFTHAIRDGIKSGIERCVSTALGASILKLRFDNNISARCMDGYRDLGIDLKTIRDTGGFLVHGLRFEIDLAHAMGKVELNFTTSNCLQFAHWHKGANPFPQVKEKIMKRWQRYRITVPRLRVGSAALGIGSEVIDTCVCNPASLKPIETGALLAFRCFVCGKQYLCECFRGIGEKELLRANYNRSEFGKLLATTPYRAEICHLCRGVPSTTGIRHQKYSEVRAFYWPYVHAFGLKLDFDWRAAENHVRDRLGVPRIGEGWLAEANLLRTVRALLPDHEVTHQASPDWLGRQRLDIFVPALKLAIEYNGEQHFFAVERFDGQRGFETTKRRDQEKRDRARQAGVTLIEFRYDEDISPAAVQQRLRNVVSIRKVLGPFPVSLPKTS